MPTIMAGIRLAAVYVIAWATLASYIGAGGLGDMIFSGLNNYQPELIFGGTIPVTIFSAFSRCSWIIRKSFNAKSFKGGRIMMKKKLKLSFTLLKQFTFYWQVVLYLVLLQLLMITLSPLQVGLLQKRRF